MCSKYSFRHRSKHILLHRENALQHDKQRQKVLIAARRLRERQKLIENNLLKQIKQLKDEQLYLENDLRQCEAYKQDLKIKLNNIFCINSLTKLLLTENNLTTNISNLNNDINNNLEN